MAETKKEKELRWLGSAREDLNNFPKEALKEAGYQLGKVQAGIEPDDWKPLDEVGAGTKEIRIWEKKWYLPRPICR